MIGCDLLHSVYDWIVIGGGASGLFAAAYLSHHARQNNTAFCGAVLEKGKRVGNKLAVTGNGTCNISHTPILESNYHGTDSAFAQAALAAFPPEKSMDFFREIGVETFVREDGRIYPTCLQASAVLDCLRAEMQINGVEEYSETVVTALKKQKELWVLKTEQGEFFAKVVIVAAGGAASPSVGGCDNGYRLLSALGCKYCTPFPSVVPLKTDTTFIRAVKGIRINANVTLLKDDHLCGSSQGEILFTEYGLSGPAIMQISRPVGANVGVKNGVFQVKLDLFPQIEYHDLLTILKLRREKLCGRTLENFFTGFIHKRIGQTLLRVCGLALNAPIESLTESQLKQLAAVCKGWKIDVFGTTGFANAQVTGGGIATKDFNPQTLEHRQHKGLFVVGEVLDVDGDCGGYNLQWAWSSAESAASQILKTRV